MGATGSRECTTTRYDFIEIGRGQGCDVFQLAQLLRSEDDNERQVAFAQVLTLADKNDNKICMGSIDLGLIEMLVGVLNENERRLHSYSYIALDILKSLSSKADNVSRMGSDELGLIEVLSYFCNFTTGPDFRAGVKSLDLLRVLSLDDDIEHKLRQNVEFIHKLVRIATTDIIDGRSGALVHNLGVLRNLTLVSETKLNILSMPGVDLIEALVSVLINAHKYVEAVILNALNILWNLSGHHDKSPLERVMSDNVERMTTAKLGLVDALIKLIHGDKKEIGVTALNIITYLSRMNKIRNALMTTSCSKDAALLVCLNKSLECNQHDIHVIVLGILVNLSTNKDNRRLLTFANPNAETSDVLPVLVRLLDSHQDSSETFRLTTLVIKNLSHDANCQLLICSEKLGFLELFCKIARNTKNSAVLVKLLAILQNVSLHADNEVRMCSNEPSLGLVELLIRIAKEDKSEARIKSLGVIWNLATNEQNKTRLCSAELGLIDALLSIIQEDEKESRMKSLGTLRVLSSNKNCILKMSEDSKCVVEMLLELCNRESLDNESVEFCLSILQNMSSTFSNKARMGSENLGLIESLIQSIRWRKEHTAIRHIFNILFNLSLHSATKQRMCSVETLGCIVDVCADVPSKESKMKCLSLLWNLSSSDGINILKDPERYLDDSTLFREESHLDGEKSCDDSEVTLEVLTSIIHNSISDNAFGLLVIALKTASYLTRNEKFQVKAVSKSPMLLNQLTLILLQHPSDDNFCLDIRHNCLNILQQLSSNSLNSLALCQMNFEDKRIILDGGPRDFFGPFMEIFCMPEYIEHDGLANMIAEIILNLATNEGNLSFMGRKNFKLVEVLVQLIVSKSKMVDNASVHMCDKLISILSLLSNHKHNHILVLSEAVVHVGVLISVTSSGEHSAIRKAGIRLLCNLVQASSENNRQQLAHAADEEQTQKPKGEELKDQERGKHRGFSLELDQVAEFIALLTSVVKDTASGKSHSQEDFTNVINTLLILTYTAEYRLCSEAFIGVYVALASGLLITNAFDCRLPVLSLLLNLATVPSNQYHMGQEQGLMEVLLQLANDDLEGVVRHKCILMFWYLSTNNSNLGAMRSEKLGLVNFLKFISSADVVASLSSNLANKNKAEETLSNLFNMDTLGGGESRRDKLDHALFEVLLAFLRSQEFAEKDKALSRLFEFSAQEENKFLIGGTDNYKCVLELMEIAKSYADATSPSEQKLCNKALLILQNVSAIDEEDSNAVQYLHNVSRLLGDLHVRFIEFLVTLINAAIISKRSNINNNNGGEPSMQNELVEISDESNSGSGSENKSLSNIVIERRITALKIISNISINSDCAVMIGFYNANLGRMANEYLGLVELMRDVVATYERTESATVALRVLYNLACHESNQRRMGMEHVGLIELMLQVVAQVRTSARAQALRIIFALLANSFNLMRIVEGVATGKLKVLETAIAVIQEGLIAGFGTKFAIVEADVRFVALCLLCRLTESKTCEVILGDENLPIVSLFVNVANKVVADVHGEVAFFKALDALVNLTQMGAFKNRINYKNKVLVDMLMYALLSSPCSQIAAVQVAALKFLSHLCINGDCKCQFGAKEFGLLDLLQTTMDSQDDDLRSTSLAFVKSLSEIDEVKANLANNSRFIDKLVAILKNDCADNRTIALGICSNLSSYVPCKVLLGSRQLSLIEHLVGMLKSETETDGYDLQTKALSILWNLSGNVDNKGRMGSNGVGVIEVVTFLLQKSASSLWNTKILGILLNLSDCEINSIAMGFDDSPLVELLMGVLSSPGTEPALRITVLMLMQNLAACSFNKQRMGSSELKLVELLMEVAKAQTDDTRVAAISVLHNISLQEDNEVRMCSNEPSLGLVELLISIAKEDKSEARIKSLGVIWNLALNDSNKTRLCSTELGLIDALLSIIQEDDTDSRNKALGILRIFSNSKVGMLKMSESFGLMEMLYRMCSRDGMDQESVLSCLGILQSLSAIHEIKVRMAADKLGLLEYLVRAVMHKPVCEPLADAGPQVQRYMAIFCILSNITSDFSNRIIAVSVNGGIIVTVLASYIEDGCTNNEFYDICVEIITNLLEFFESKDDKDIANSLGPKVKGLIPHLVSSLAVAGRPETSRFNVIKAICYMLQLPDALAELLSDDVGVAALVKAIVLAFHDDGTDHKVASYFSLRILTTLVGVCGESHYIWTILGSKDSIELLIELFASDDNIQTRLNMLSILQKLSLQRDSSILMCSSHLGLMQLLVSLATTNLPTLLPNSSDGNPLVYQKCLGVISGLLECNPDLCVNEALSPAVLADLVRLLYTTIFPVHATTAAFAMDEAETLAIKILVMIGFDKLDAEIDICDILMKVYDVQKENENVLRWFCSSIANLPTNASSSEVRLRLVESGAGGVLAGMLCGPQANASTLFLEQVASAVQVIVAGLPVNQTVLGDEGCCESLVSILQKIYNKRPIYSERLLEVVCEAIKSLCGDSMITSVNLARLGEAGACEALTALLKCEQRLTCLRSICGIIRALSSFQHNSERFLNSSGCIDALVYLAKTHDTSSGLCEQIYSAMRVMSSFLNRNTLDILRSCGCCELLANIVTVVAAQATESYYDETFDDAVFEDEEGLALSSNKAPKVEPLFSVVQLEEAIATISNMSISHANKVRFGELGCCQALVTILEEELVETHFDLLLIRTCVAICNLSSNNLDNKVIFGRCGVCEALTKALLSFQENLSTSEK